MNTNYINIEKVVAKIQGKIKGNAILIDKFHAITVRHCVKEERILLVFPKLFANEVKKVWAKSDIFNNVENDDFIMLELEQELLMPDVNFASEQLLPHDEADVYGYDGNYRAEGKWTKLVFCGSAMSNPDLRQDLLFDIKLSRENNFSGLSGSPIVKDNCVIGIVAQEMMESQNAITLHGISIKSSMDFFERNSIPVRSIPESTDISFESNMTIGGYGKRDSSISVAGELEIKTRVQGIYKEKLDEIVSMHREGDVKGAWERLKKQIIELDKDLFVDNAIKAEYHYRMAVWFLEDRHDIGKAQKRYEKTLELNPDFDGSIFEAVKLSLSEDNLNAEQRLEPVDSISKFNTYLQICINTDKKEKAYKKYEEIEPIITFDATTYYLLSILEVLRKNYNNALSYAEKALTEERKIPFYHMMKGIILYWKALPPDVCQTNDLYPTMFIDGLLHLDGQQQKMIIDATEEYRKAYQLAKNVENEEQEVAILSFWTNTLTVDRSFENHILEPMQRLKEINPFNVTYLLYSIHMGIEIDCNVTLVSLEKQIKNSPNKIGHIIALVELSILKEDKKNAKRILHEYRSLFMKGEYYDHWYEYIVKVEESKNKLKEYEEEIEKNYKLGEIQQKRLLCLFIQLDCERDEELETQLFDIFSKTKKRLDILNLIVFYRSRRKWELAKKYAEQLETQYNDVFGTIYKIQSLIELEEYEAALGFIDEMIKCNIAGTETVLLQNQMMAYERRGSYADAITSGEKLLKKKATEQLILEIASLHALNGDEAASLTTLLKAEENDLLTVTVCQRISNFYLATDERNAWNYAVKAVEISNRQPEIMLWAWNIANRIGRGDKAGEYFHEIMMENSNHHLFVEKSFDEVAEIIRKSKENVEENIKMLYQGELVSHLFVDTYQGEQTYAEFFYTQWNSGEIAPMEFGAHFNHDNMQKIETKRIALDYSSCMLLKELNLLEMVCSNMEQVYISGDLFGIMSEEIRNIPVNQPDIIISRHQLLEKCKKELKITFVEMQVPENIENMNVVERVSAVNLYTAKVNNAKWVSEEIDKENLLAEEVIYSLYKEGKISKSIIDVDNDIEKSCRKEKIQYLMNEHPVLLVDQDIVEKWDKLDLLFVICESYTILAERNMEESIEKDYELMQQKIQVTDQLKTLRKILLTLKDQGKISFFPAENHKDNMKYSNMLLEFLSAADHRGVAVCIDDRVMTSYSSTGKSSIYNSFDMLKMLFLSKNISLETFCNTWKRALGKNIRYVLPDNQFMLCALKLSTVDREKKILKESEMLTLIRKYIVRALSEESFLSHTQVEHVRIPEWEYFVFYLQGQARDLIRLVWKSDMDNAKKYMSSEWILSHYSQFAFDFSEVVDEKNRRVSHAIQLADFLIEGILLAVDEKCVEQYYSWLYGWFDHYLEKNHELRKRTINFTKEFIVSARRNCIKRGNKQEIGLTNMMFATGIYYMPEKYREALLDNSIISNMYNSIYCQISVSLTQKRQIPVNLFRVWEKEILSMNENMEIQKKYRDVCFTFSWSYIIPAFPGLTVRWKEEEHESVRYIRMDMGERLRHDDRNIRKKEFKYLEPYIEEIDYSKQYLELQNPNKYINASEEILYLLDMTEKFAEERIECGIKNNWLSDDNSRKWMLPANLRYFKEKYDVSKMSNCLAHIDEKTTIALPVQFEQYMENFEVRNHSPVRLLHKLGGLFASDAKTDEILNVIDKLFTYNNSESEEYGYGFILLLKVIWNLVSEIDIYMNEPYENRLVWTYIWVDKIMTSLARLEEDGTVNIAAYIKKLKKYSNIDLDTDGLWREVSKEDIISPCCMNLYKLCVIGTLQICSSYENRMQEMSLIILQKLNYCYLEWMKMPIHFCEVELLHNKTMNVFESIFNKNFYLLVETLEEMNDSIDTLYTWKRNGKSSNRMQYLLQNALDEENISFSEILYLFFITRENMETVYSIMVEEIIKKQVMEKEIKTDLKWHRILAYIVRELSENFQNQYFEHEFARLGELLRTEKIQFKETFQLVVEMVHASSIERFLDFWDAYAEALNPSDSLELAENIGWVQRNIEFEYAQRARRLRIQLELKS